MSVIGLKVGPFEIVGPAWVPEPGRWYLARRSGGVRRQPDAVLVRVLPPDASPEERAAVQRQFEALRGLEDSRIPQPVAYYEGMGALAIDAAVGAPLADALRRGLRLSQATVLDVLLEVAETLQRVHHRNRFHGHLDPEQVVLAADGGVWLFGFGAADVAPDPRWAAPERVRGEPATAATDQWSLGALAGALALTTDAPPSADALESEWPPLGRIVRRMCDPHPANRFPSLHPVRQELLALTRRTGGVSERRDVASRLVRERAPPVDPPSEVPAPAPPPAPPATPEPAPALALDATPPSSEPTPRLTPRRAERLPAEEIPVVRPDVSEEVPLAGIGRPEPAPEPPPAPPPVPDLAPVWRDAPDPGLVTAPTVVPITDSGDGTDPGRLPLDPAPKPADPPSASEAWFEPPTSPPGRPDPSLGLTGISAVLPSSEPALPPEEEDPPAPAAPSPPPAAAFPIQRVAPVLAVLLAVLVVLWLVRVLG